MITPFETSLTIVRARITQAAQKSHRESSQIRLLAMSKGQSIEKVALATATGLREFGENYLQEAVKKIEHFAHEPLVWHFTGPIQSNKTALIARYFDWVQSLDRIKIAQRLEQQRPQEKAPLQVLIQINISGELQKSGIAPNELMEFAAQLQAMPRLALRGIMTIAEHSDQPTRLQQQFQQMRELFEPLKAEHGSAIDTLSMGMSEDLELAIAEGATLVRVGTALFGGRA